MNQRADWRDCPAVETVPGRLSGVPVLKGTRMPVQGVLENYDAGLSPSEVAETFNLSLAAVEAVLLFRERQFESAARP